MIDPNDGCHGSTKVFTAPSGIITSPGYDGLTPYENDVDCSWIIEAPAGKSVTIKFHVSICWSFRSRGLGTLGWFSAISANEDNFCNFLFAFLHIRGFYWKTKELKGDLWSRELREIISAPRQTHLPTYATFNIHLGDFTMTNKINALTDLWVDCVWV